MKLTNLTEMAADRQLYSYSIVGTYCRLHGENAPCH